MHTLLDKTKLWATVYASIVLGAVMVISAVLCQRAAAQAPTPFLVSPYFGQKTITQPYQVGHPAYDFSMNYERVLVAADGTVDQSQWYNNNCHNSATWPNDDNNCGYGLYVRVNHGNNYRTIYGHLSVAGRTANAPVTRGQIIGTSGNTGWSTGAHLHFQVQHFLNNVWTSIDPFGESGVSLWIDGEWGSPSRPIPEPINGGETFTYATIASTGGFSKGENNGVMPPPFNNGCMGDCANWAVSTSTYGYKYSTLVNGSTPDSWAKWQAAVSPNGGMYEVFVYIPSGVNAPSWQAPYTIRYLNNVTQATALVDQYVGNHWVSLGTYYMTNNDYVFITDATGETAGEHRLSADAVKFVQRGNTYSPYLNTTDNWMSTVTARNDGGGAAQVYLSLFNNAGSLQCSSFVNVAGRATQSFAVTATSCPAAKSAIVNSSQDLAITTREENGNGELNAYNGLLASGGSLGWEQVGSTVYVPLIKNARYGRSSKMFIMNTGLQSTVASVEFFNADTGQSMGSPATYSLNVNASQPVNATSCGAGNRCSVKITSSAGQPLAVAVLEKDDATTAYRATYSGFSSGTTQNFAPIVKRNRYGRTTGLVIENVGTTSTNISVTCYDLTGGSCNCGSYTSLPFKATFVLTPLSVPDNFVGSALVTSSSQPIVTTIYESGSPQQQVANAPLTGTGYAYVPELYGNYLMSGQTWNSGIAVQNVGAGNAAVTVTYYNQAGTQIDVKTVSGLQQNRVWILNRSANNLPDNFAGSAVITANQPVVAIANHSHTGNGDTTASYTVPNR